MIDRQTDFLVAQRCRPSKNSFSSAGSVRTSLRCLPLRFPQGNQIVLRHVMNGLGQLGFDITGE